MKILHIHIPRTAGTFIAHNLATNLGYPATFSIDHKKFDLEHFKTYREGIVADYSFITGHIPFSFVDDIADRFDYILTVVRSPFARLLSMYRYKLQHDEKPPPDEISSLRQFFHEHYAANESTRNEQCGYLGASNRLGSVLDVFRRFPNFVIFRQEDLATRFPEFMRQAGLRFDSGIFRNESGSSEKLWREVAAHAPDDASLLTEIQHWFDEDYLLYEYLSEHRLSTRHKWAHPST